MDVGKDFQSKLFDGLTAYNYFLSHNRTEVNLQGHTLREEIDGSEPRPSDESKNSIYLPNKKKVTILKFCQ